LVQNFDRNHDQYFHHLLYVHLFCTRFQLIVATAPLRKGAIVCPQQTEKDKESQRPERLGCLNSSRDHSNPHNLPCDTRGMFAHTAPVRLVLSIRQKNLQIQSSSKRDLHRSHTKDYYVQSFSSTAAATCFEVQVHKHIMTLWVVGFLELTTIVQVKQHH
jgi:hypothetical protein